MIYRRWTYRLLLVLLALLPSLFSCAVPVATDDHGKTATEPNDGSACVCDKVSGRFVCVEDPDQPCQDAEDNTLKHDAMDLSLDEALQYLRDVLARQQMYGSDHALAMASMRRVGSSIAEYTAALSDRDRQLREAAEKIQIQAARIEELEALVQMKDRLLAGKADVGTTGRIATEEVKP